MIIDAVDVNRAFCPAEQSHIGASNATIRPPIDESAEVVGVTAGIAVQHATSSAGDGVGGPRWIGVVKASDGRGTKVLTARPAVPDMCSV